MADDWKLKDVKDLAQHPESYQSSVFFKRVHPSKKTSAELALKELVEYDSTKVDAFITKIISIFKEHKNYNTLAVDKALQEMIAYTTQNNILTTDHINQIFNTESPLALMPNSLIDWCKNGTVNPAMLSFRGNFGMGSMTLFQHLLTNNIKIGKDAEHPSIFVARHFPESGGMFLSAELKFYQHEVQRLSAPAGSQNAEAPNARETEQFRQNNYYYEYQQNFINFVKKVVKAEVKQKGNKHTILSELQPLGNQPHQQAAYKEMVQTVFANIKPKQFASISEMLKRDNPQMMHYILKNNIKIGSGKQNALFAYKDGSLNPNFTKQDIYNTLNKDPKLLVDAHKKGLKAGDRDVLEFALSGSSTQIDQSSGKGTALFMYVTDHDLAAAISDTSAKNIGEMFKQRIGIYLAPSQDAGTGTKISEIMCELIAHAQKNPQDMQAITEVYQACQEKLQAELSDGADIISNNNAKKEFSAVLEECSHNKKTAALLMKRAAKEHSEYGKMKYAFFMLDLEDACKNIDAMRYLAPKDKALDSGFVERVINNLIDIVCSIGKSKDNIYEKAKNATNLICNGAKTEVFSSRSRGVSQKADVSVGRT